MSEIKDFNFSPELFLYGSSLERPLQLLEPSIIAAYKGWETAGFPNEDPFVAQVLGRESFRRPGGTVVRPIFGLYWEQSAEKGHPPFEGDSEAIRNMVMMENKIAAVIIASLLAEVQRTEGGFSKRLAGLLTAAQLVSTNLSFAPANRPLLVAERKESLSFQDWANIGKVNERIEKFVTAKAASQEINDRDKPELVKNMETLFLCHFLAMKEEIEEGSPIHPPLAQAFLKIVDLWLGSCPSNEPVSCKLAFEEGHDNAEKFFKKYLEGLLAFLIQSKNEGEQSATPIIYLGDYLSRFLAEQGINVKEIRNSEDLVSCLLKQTEKDSFLDFNLPEAKVQVREIWGRYDYRALLDYLLNLGKESISVCCLGFGELGVAPYELYERLTKEGMRVEIFGVDILPLNLIRSPEKYSVVKFEKGPGGGYCRRRTRISLL